MIGFLWYLIYLIYGYIYQHKHDTTKSIVWQDLAWCSITLFVVYAIAIQCWIYRKTITETIHPFYQLSMAAIFIITAYNLFLVKADFLPIYTVADGGEAYSFMHFLGYSKAYISFIKYFPQCKLNFERKTTAGFSILQVLLDVTGALTSFTQSMLNAWNHPKPDGKPDLDTVFGNLPKLFLSLESLFFCSILLFQHYILYADNHPNENGHDTEMVHDSDNAVLIKKSPNNNVNNNKNKSRDNSPKRTLLDRDDESDIDGDSTTLLSPRGEQIRPSDDHDDDDSDYNHTQQQSHHGIASIHDDMV